MSRGPDPETPKSGLAAPTVAPPAPFGRHTNRAYGQELATVRRRVLLMGSRTHTMILEAVRALTELDAARAQRTIALDRDVNRDEIEIDAYCLEILARRQPLASDLRFLTLVFKMVTDLERIGDLAVNICERTIDLSTMAQRWNLQELAQLGGVVASMVLEAIESFVEPNAERARAVIARDDEADELYHRVFRNTLQAMVANAGAVEAGIHIQSAAKFLERMADHATNLAEDVVFLVEGADIRHAGKLRRTDKAD